MKMTLKGGNTPMTAVPDYKPNDDTRGITISNHNKDGNQMKNRLTFRWQSNDDLESEIVKETVSRDFRPLVFFLNQLHLGP
jgi:hypothetical protein